MIQLIDADTIIDLVVDYYATDREMLLSKRRYKELVIPRHVCRYLINKNTRLTLRRIAEVMQGHKYSPNDHSTIISSCNVIRDLMDTDDTLLLEVTELQDTINSYIKKELDKVANQPKSRRERLLSKRRAQTVVTAPAPVIRLHTESEHEKLSNKYL
jgi:hypothetical protein